MPDFITDFLHHTKDYESPTAFWQWSAYCTISAILRDSCYKTRGDSYLYPNIYTLLLADSSGHRKGNPIDLCESLVNNVNNTKAIGGSTSIQALLNELSHTETDSKTGKLKKPGAGIFIAQEFSAAIVEDPRAVKILTDIYDYKPCGYAIRLITRVSTKIDKLVLSLFAASNEAMLRGFFEDAAIYGGFLARTFLVTPKGEQRPSNPLWDTPEQIACRRESFTNLLKRLREIGTLSGEFVFEEDTKAEYNRWYIPFREGYFKQPDKTGVTGRIHTSIIKISMLLAANDMCLVVRKHHMEKAIFDCTSLLSNYREFTMTSGGKSTVKETGAIVLRDLLLAKGHRKSRTHLLQEHWNEFDAEALDKFVVTAEGGKLIKQVTSQEKTGIETHYELTPSGLETLTGQKETTP